MNKIRIWALLSVISLKFFSGSKFQAPNSQAPNFSVPNSTPKSCFGSGDDTKFLALKKIVEDAFAKYGVDSLTNKKGNNQISYFIMGKYKKSSKSANMVLITPETRFKLVYWLYGSRINCINYKSYNIYVVTTDINLGYTNAHL